MCTKRDAYVPVRLWPEPLLHHMCSKCITIAQMRSDVCQCVHTPTNPTPTPSNPTHPHHPIPSNPTHPHTKSLTSNPQWGSIQPLLKHKLGSEEHKVSRNVSCPSCGESSEITCHAVLSVYHLDDIPNNQCKWEMSVRNQHTVCDPCIYCMHLVACSFTDGWLVTSDLSHTPFTTTSSNLWKLH